MTRLKPLNDFVFQKIFGEEESSDILLAFLNAVLGRTQKEPLTEVKIDKNKQLTKEMIKDKTGRLDVRATTARGEQIDIEVQLTDQSNMDKRTLFYWGKLYLEGIKQGEDYTTLKKVITINLLNFEFLETKSYHSSFHLWQDYEEEYMLTDLVEIHFIEQPKFRKLKEKNYKDEALLCWLKFLETDVNEEELEVLMNMEPAIRMAEEKLEHLSSDPEVLALYKAREDSAHEKANLIATGIERGLQKGLQKGLEQEKYNTAKRLLLKGLPIQLVCEATELSGEQVTEIKKQVEREN